MIFIGFRCTISWKPYYPFQASRTLLILLCIYSASYIHSVHQKTTCLFSSIIVSVYASPLFLSRPSLSLLDSASLRRAAALSKGSKSMSVPYPNGFQLSNVRTKCRLFSSSRTRVSPVFACLKSSELALPLEAKVDPLLGSVKWDDKGLAVAIAQNVDTGAVLMQGFVNREALLKTISSRKATFYSRSRSTLWTKGETSMNFINICDVFIDCGRDSIIYLGKPDGPTCHTGSEICYYTSVNEVLSDSQVDGEEKLALTTLYSLESTISKRKEELSGNTGKPSWTKRLLLDEKLLCSKIREEADELCRTLEENDDVSRTASEMADVLYHSMVLMALKGVKVEDVLQVLRLRFSRSGIEEKSSRKS